MEIWLIAFLGGFVGSVLMDLTENQMLKFGYSSGVKGKYIGRWAGGWLAGRFMHQDIAQSKPVNHEERIGQIFHFVIGGGVVALLYPLFLYSIGVGDKANHLCWSMMFGLLTSVLPWFVLMPAFGWGLFGLKAPTGSRPFISPILSHIPYGFGIGISFITIDSLRAI